MTHQKIADLAEKIHYRKPWQSNDDNWFEAEEMLKVEEFMDKFEAWRKRLNVKTGRMW